MSINVVIISGVIERKFDPRTLDSGAETHAAILKSEAGEGKTSNHIINAWSKYSHDQLAKAGVGDHVLINGSLRKSSFKKDDVWVEKYEISIQHLEVLSSSVLGGIDDDAGFNDAPVYAAAAAAGDDDGKPFG